MRNPTYLARQDIALLILESEAYLEPRQVSMTGLFFHHKMNA